MIRKRCNTCGENNNHYPTKKIMCVKCLKKRADSAFPLKKQTLSDMFHSPNTSTKASNSDLGPNRTSQEDVTETTDEGDIAIRICETCRCLTVTSSQVNYLALSSHTLNTSCLTSLTLIFYPIFVSLLVTKNTNHIMLMLNKHNFAGVDKKILEDWSSPYQAQERCQRHLCRESLYRTRMP